MNGTKKTLTDSIVSLDSHRPWCVYDIDIEIFLDSFALPKCKFLTLHNPNTLQKDLDDNNATNNPNTSQKGINAYELSLYPHYFLWFRSVQDKFYTLQ